MSKITAAAAGLLMAGGMTVSPASATTLPAPMVVLAFSRSETSNAVNCVADTSPTAVSFFTTVAPELARRGFTPTGTVETDLPGMANPCVKTTSLVMSWADMARASSTFGMRFVSHGATRVDLTSLPADQVTWQLTSSLQALDAHGYGPYDRGLYAFQNNKYNDILQAQVRLYYDLGRTYVFTSDSVNTHTNVDPARYFRDRPAGGGHCVIQAGTCPSSGSPSYAVNLYKTPNTIASFITGLQRGQAFMTQSYIFVTGSRAALWDCTSSDVRLHWTYDPERYCWSDYKTILNAISARPDIVVTDPYTLARAWYPTAAAPAR